MGSRICAFDWSPKSSTLDDGERPMRIAVKMCLLFCRPPQNLNEADPYKFFLPFGPLFRMFPLKVRGEFYREETRVMVLLSGEDRMLVANYPCQRVTDTPTDRRIFKLYVNSLWPTFSYLLYNRLR